MARRSKCGVCGSEDIVAGSVTSHYSVGFIPEGAGLFGKINRLSPVTAELCMKCGDLRLRGDVQWVAKILGRFVPGRP